MGFKPKPFEQDETKRDDPRAADPVLKEGALLTNVFNRLARSCFYEAQKNFEGYMPIGAVSPEAVEKVHATLSAYDFTMHKAELHTIMSIMDEYIRWSNKYWTERIREVENAASALEENGDVRGAAADELFAKRRQVLVDCFFLLRIATLLMHPVVPAGTEKICDYLSFEFDEFFSWNYDFEDNAELCGAGEITEGRHRIRELPPRTDFFERHPSQFK